MTQYFDFAFKGIFFALFFVHSSFDAAFGTAFPEESSGLLETAKQDIQRRMAFKDIAEVPGTKPSKVLLLDSLDKRHCSYVLDAFLQIDTRSQVSVMEAVDFQQGGIAKYFNIFAKEQFDVVNISLSGYYREHTDFALIYALARCFPHTHFVVAIGNKGSCSYGYPYPEESKKLLADIKHQLTFALLSESNMQEERISEFSLIPKDFDMSDLYEERSLMAPGQLGERVGSSFSAPRITGCLARLCQVYGLSPHIAAALLLETAKKPVDYHPSKDGRGFVDYARAAQYASQAQALPHATSSSAPLPAYEEFCDDYHVFQWIAAVRNTSNFVMTFGSPHAHFMTDRVLPEGADELLPVSRKDARKMLTELEEIYQGKMCKFVEFATCLLKGPLNKHYPGCTSYLFLRHDDVQRGALDEERDYRPCATVPQTLEDFFELMMMAHKRRDLPLVKACLAELPLQDAPLPIHDFDEGLLKDREEVATWLSLLQCMGTYDFFDYITIESFLFDIQFLAYLKWERGPSIDVMNAVMHKINANLGAQLLATKSEGNPHFFLLLGMCHEGGRFKFETDHTLASAWYEKVLACQDTTESLHATAKIRLSECQARNTRRAFAFFERMANKSH